LAEYPYLASSLPDLLDPEGVGEHPFSAFDAFAREELREGDYRRMRGCFITADVINLLRRLRSSNPEAPPRLLEPSFFTPEELAEGLGDSDRFPEPFAEFLWAWRNERLHLEGRSPETVLGESLMSWIVTDGRPLLGNFTRDFVIWDMHRRNIATALAGRSADMDYRKDIIVFDDWSSRVAESGAPDFGWGGELGRFASMVDHYESDSPLEREQRATRVRWDWLDDRCAGRPFEAETIAAVAVKIADVERWLVLSPDEGRRRLDEIVESLHHDIRKLALEESVL